jgi:hypothetical protein
MKIGALIVLGMAALFTQPALAQNSPSGAAKTTSVSFDSLLAEGYEIKATTLFSGDVVKEAYAKSDLPSQVLVTLQKGPSLATCGLSVISLVNLTDAAMANTNFCSKH